jgi:hypothetical protein
MVKLPKTLQEVFDIVSKHLLKQNERSAFSDESCSYRGPNGLKCAAGILIPDEEYTFDSFEGKDWGHLVQNRYVESRFSEEIIELQNIHDLERVERWKDELINFANNYNLQVNFEV